MPRRKRASTNHRKRQRWADCGCPHGSKRVRTGGRGRGWACQSNRPKRFKIKKGPRRGRTQLVKKPFVRAVCW